MKKSLACQDMGVTSCSFEVRSESREEIKDAMFAHAEKHHAEMFSNMSPQQQSDMVRLMDEKLK